MSMVSSIRAAATQALPGSTGPQAAKAAGSEFSRILRARLDERQISVSVHAADRMMRRGLQIDEHTADKLRTAFDLAEEKGSREALFLLDEMAVIASVPDRTVKTVLDRRAMAEGVFTRIDTTVVLTGGMSKNQTNKQLNNQPINQSPGSNGWAPTREATIQSGGLPL